MAFGVRPSADTIERFDVGIAGYGFDAALTQRNNKLL
jgi:hypothetical protein